MEKKHLAYDYDAQQWVEGDEARLELIRQHRQELTILESPDGLAYVKFATKRPADTVNAAMVDALAAQLRKAIAELEHEGKAGDAD
jgi:hypothetical protein